MQLLLHYADCIMPGLNSKQSVLLIAVSLPVRTANRRFYQSWLHKTDTLVVQVLHSAGVAGFQIRAMDAAVCALWALCRHWQDPQAAVIAAVRGVPA